MKIIDTRMVVTKDDGGLLRFLTIGKAVARVGESVSIKGAGGPFFLTQVDTTSLADLTTEQLRSLKAEAKGVLHLRLSRLHGTMLPQDLTVTMYTASETAGLTHEPATPVPVVPVVEEPSAPEAGDPVVVAADTATEPVVPAPRKRRPRRKRSQ
jgi:hypothetical protein